MPLTLTCGMRPGGLVVGATIAPVGGGGGGNALTLNGKPLTLNGSTLVLGA